MTAVDSMARVQQVMRILGSHPDGLPLDVVATELGVTQTVLRREILEYYGADIPPHVLMGLDRPTTIEFIAADGEEVDPHRAPMIRAVSDRPEAELGVQYLRAEELVALYEAGRSLSQVEPENEVLSDAVQKLADSFLGGLTETAEAAEPTTVLTTLRQAIAERVPVRIDYSRAWRPGITTRVVEPYRLLHTTRGWEVDAGPVADGRARSYIVDRISAAELTDGAFDRPAGVEELLAAERSPVEVQLSLPQRTHWVVDRFAERSTVLAADADDLTVRAEFLPPVAERVGLVLVIAGPQAFVIDPPGLVGCGSEQAAALLAHHGLSGAD